MARKKVKLAFIENDTSRKATLKKRRQGLMKKVSELSALCGVNACAIVYSPDSGEPVFWPSRPEVEELLVRYRSFSEVERSRKMVNQESYLKEQINKLIRQKKKLAVKNKELENSYLMQQLYLSGKTTSEFANDEMCSLFYYIHEKTKEIERKIELLRQSDGAPRSGGAPSSIEGPVVEEGMILEAKEGGGGNNNGDNRGDASSSLDQWFVDIMNSGNAGSGSGSKKDELYPLACLTGGASTSNRATAFNLSLENIGVGSGNWASGIGPVNGDAGGSGNNIVLSQGLSRVIPGRGPLVTYGHVGGSASNNAATPYQGYVGHMSRGSGMMCPNGDAGGYGGDGPTGYGVRLFNQRNAGGSSDGNGEVFPQGGIYGVNNNTGYGMRQHNENPGAVTNVHGVVLPLTNNDHGVGNGGCGIGLNHSNAGVITNGHEMSSTYGDVVSNGYGIVVPPLVARPIANAGSGNVEWGMGMYQGNLGAIDNGNNRAIDNGPFEGGNGGFRAMVPLGNLVGNIDGNEVWMLHDNAVVDANGSGGNNGGMK
ncbi:MADS-box domain-containing protein [Psidium guajava]|nr:MADS-box domain-containing protein [Psidium guajava]